VHSPPSIAEIKNEGVISTLLDKTSWYDKLQAKKGCKVVPVLN
jgi:hypothetical protein